MKIEIAHVFIQDLSLLVCGLLRGSDLFMIIPFRSCFLWAKFVRRQQQTISNFYFLINNTHNSCQQSYSKTVVPGMNEWWRELKTESPQNKVRCSELLSAKRSIKYEALWKLQNWYKIARVGGQGLLLTWYHHFKNVSISGERCLSWNIFFIILKKSHSIATWVIINRVFAKLIR